MRTVCELIGGPFHGQTREVVRRPRWLIYEHDQMVYGYERITDAPWWRIYFMWRTQEAKEVA